MSRDAVVSDVIKTHARSLKMPGLLRAYEPLARQAREERWSFEDYLHEVLAVEVQSRVESAVRQRIREAHFPEPKTLDTFDFAASEGIDATHVADLARGRWISEAENLILVGPIGTEKAPCNRPWQAWRPPGSAGTWPSGAPPTSSERSSRRATSAS